MGRARRAMNVDAAVTQLNGLLPFRNRRKTEVIEASSLQEMTSQIVEMEALHNEDDRAVDLVVETRQQCVFVPLDGFVADRF